MAVRVLAAPLTWHWRWAWRLVNLVGVFALVYFWADLQTWIFDGSASAYYHAELDSTLYARTWNIDPHAYVYPPPFRQIIEPLTWLDWPAFYAIWTGLLTVILAWLVSPAIAAVLMTHGWEPFWHSVATGDVALLMAAALVMRPAAWAVLPLLKVTPGVAFAWFVVRREWRSLGVAVGATAAVVAGSFAIYPALWGDWLALMLRSAEAPLIGVQVPTWARLLPALAVVVIGAWRNWRWLLPIAAVIAMPNLTWTSLAVLAAVPRLVNRVEAEPAEVDAEARRVDPHEQGVLIVGC